MKYQRYTCTLLFFLIVFGVIAKQHAQELTSNFKNGNLLTDGNIFTTRGCTPEDFVYGSTCTLHCSVIPSEQLQYYEAYFYYKADDKIIFTDHPNITITEGARLFSIDFKLDDYRAGAYVCVIILKNVATNTMQEFYNSFKIDTRIDGVGLDGSCVTHQDCIALNSFCYHSTCQCVGLHFIKALGHSACLMKSGYKQACQNSAQCNDVYDDDPSHGNLSCVNGVCVNAGRY